MNKQGYVGAGFAPARPGGQVSKPDPTNVGILIGKEEITDTMRLPRLPIKSGWLAMTIAVPFYFIIKNRSRYQLIF